MQNIPNKTVLRDITQKFDKEYNPKARIKRYETLTPELMELATKQGLNNEEASYSLFVADYTVTASDIPSGTDEKRYLSVINTFVQGSSRCSSPNCLTHIFYFAHKIARIIRNQDLFMCERGLSPREVALIQLKDSYITPYLLIASKILGTGSCGWELGILSAALNKTYPENETEKFIDA